MFLVEVKQAGVFLMRNLSDDDTRRAIGTICPNVLFPFARAAVSNLVTPGRLPAVPAAAGELRGAVRGGAAAADAANSSPRRHRKNSTPVQPHELARRTDPPIAVLGAGSWGTALAIQFARSGKADAPVGPRCRSRWRRWSRERRNERYLPQARLPRLAQRRARIWPRAGRCAGRADRRAQRFASAPCSGRSARARPADAAGLGHQGLRGRQRPAAAPGGARGAGHRPRVRGAVGSDLRARSRRGPAHGHDRGLPGCRLRRGPRAGSVVRQLPRLHLHATSSASKSAGR